MANLISFIHISKQILTAYVLLNKEQIPMVAMTVEEYCNKKQMERCHYTC